MALIRCPECSHDVSDQAAACPNCGYPLHAGTAPTSAGPSLGDTDTRLTQTLLMQGKIAAIKLYRELHPGTDLAEAKERVDRLEANLPAGSGRRTGGGAGCLLVIVALLLAAAVSSGLRAAGSSERPGSPTSCPCPRADTPVR